MRRMATGGRTTPFWVGVRLARRADRERRWNGETECEVKQRSPEAIKLIRKLKVGYGVWLIILSIAMPVIMILSGNEFTSEQYLPWLCSIPVFMAITKLQISRNKKEEREEE